MYGRKDNNMKVAKVVIQMDNGTKIEFKPSHFSRGEVEAAYDVKYEEKYSKEEYEKAKNAAKFILGSKF